MFRDVEVEEDWSERYEAGPEEEEDSSDAAWEDEGEPNCVDCSNGGWVNVEYDLSADTLYDVILIETNGNTAIEKKADKRYDQDAPDVLTSNGVIFI